MSSEEQQQRFEVLQHLIASHLGITESKIQPSSTLSDDLGLDSIGIVELTTVIEEHLHIVIPDDVLEHMQKVDDLARYLATLPEV